MSDSLVMRFRSVADAGVAGGADSGGPDVDWVVVTADGARVGESGSGPLADVLQRAADRVLMLLAPGVDVLLSQINVPSSNRQQRLKAAPYALEEQLADDVEDLHFAIGDDVPAPLGAGPDAGTASAVAVIHRRRMDDWLGPLTEAGLNPDSMQPDILAVPLPAGGWGILCLPDSCLVRTGPQSGFAADYDNLMVLLELALDRQATPPAMITLIGDCGDLSTSLAGLLEDKPTVIEQSAAPAGSLAALALGAAQQRSLDLLQGDYQRRNPAGDLVRRWLPVAGLLLFWLVAELGIGFYQTSRLQNESRALAQQAEQIYRDAFPAARNVVDPEAQMRTALKKLQSGGATSGYDFVGLLARVGQTLRQFPAVSLQRIDFRQGRFDIELRAGNLQMFDRVQQSLKKNGLSDARILSANQQGSAVQGRMRISGGGS